MWDKAGRLASAKRCAGSVKRAILRMLCRRDVLFSNQVPLISFTFDDFPRSALTVGGKILESCRLRGTYFVAPQLIKTWSAQGEHFHPEDLERLSAQGHEIGSHTNSHISSRNVALEAYRKDVIEANGFIHSVTGSSRPNFAYPFGHVTVAAKREMGKLHSSCRSTYGGINHDRIDLNMLRANRLYGSTGINSVKELIRKNRDIGGWLIFYTHDVRESPSPYGCTPRFFEQVVKQAVESGACILTVAEALGVIVDSNPDAGLG